MNRKRFGALCLVFALVAVSWTAGGASAQHYILGDLGKPDDYDATMKLFRDTVADFDSLVDQLPTEFDWRTLGKVTPAKDQQSCGSCWAFASVGAFESKLLILGKPAYDLSEQQQISCNLSMAGCSGGGMQALQFWETLGPMQESCTGYPSYDGSEPACSTLSGCATLAYRTANYYTVDTSSQDEVKTSLYNDGPTYFRFNVYSDFYTFWNSAASGVVYTQSSGTYEGGHAVLLIGWSDTKGAWLFKNSWGATDGPNGDGTFWMAYTGHVQDLGFGMANVDVTAYKPPLTPKKLMFLRRALPTGPFGIQVFSPPTTVGGSIGSIQASDNDIGRNVRDVAAGDYGITRTGDELVVLTQDTATVPNKLLVYNLPPGPNKNTGPVIASDTSIGKDRRFVASGDFTGDGKEELAVARRNPATGKYELSIYKMPKTVGGEVVLLASDMNIGANIMGLAAGNYDTDTKDELFVIAGNATKAALYIYKAPTQIGGNTGTPIASDIDIGAGVTTRGLAAGNFDGDTSNIELAILRKKPNGALVLQVFRPPSKVKGDIGNPIASDTSIDSKFVGVAAVDCVPPGQGFFEDFDDGVAQNWVTDNSGVWSVAGGVYRMTGNSPATSTVRYSYYNRNFADFTYEVDVLRTQGTTSSSQGMIFRSDGSEANCYVFHTDATGYYLIYKYVNGASSWLISNWTYTSALNVGYNVWNTLKVVANGSTLQFYANGTLLETISDTSFTTGKVGVKAYDVSYDSNVKHFDNAKLTVPTNASAEISSDQVLPALEIPASAEATEDHR
jgi:hypothetical protein